MTEIKRHTSANHQIIALLLFPMHAGQFFKAFINIKVSKRQYYQWITDTIVATSHLMELKNIFTLVIKKCNIHVFLMSSLFES